MVQDEKISLMRIFGDRSHDWQECEVVVEGSRPLRFLIVLDHSPSSGISVSTDSMKTFDQAGKWLENCLQRHSTCSDPACEDSEYSEFSRSAKERPLKVLYGDAENIVNTRFLRIDHDPIKVVETIEPLEYACLSHCWGPPGNMIKTKEKDLDNFKREGIPWVMIPRTFQDAIRICRHVGVMYLWIDSLCIIQDNENDWREQSSQMATIYGQALFTIAASKSHSPSQGLFTERSQRYLDSKIPGYSGVRIRQKLPDPANIVAVDHFYKPRGTVVPYGRSYTSTDTDREEWPLYFREWCFQELRLSRRILHFGLHEVLWECKEGRCRESIPCYLDKTNIPPRTHGVPIDPSAWHAIIRSYTRRALTYPSDRLPAIAAVAQMFQAGVAHREYIAGLWLETLFEDLLWKNEDPTSQRWASPSDIMPSWSWASVTGGIKFHDLSSQWFCWLNSSPTPKTQYIILPQLFDIAYTTELGRITGRIKEASMHLKTSLISFSDIVPEEEFTECEARSLQVDRLEKIINCDYEAFGKLFGKTSRRLMVSRHNLHWDVPEALAGASWYNHMRYDLAVFPIVAERTGSRFKNIRGPIVRRTGLNTFKRVGFCVIEHLGAFTIGHYYELLYLRITGKEFCLPGGRPPLRRSGEVDPCAAVRNQVLESCSRDFEKWFDTETRQEVRFV